MSFQSFNKDRPRSQPAILSRKRKAETELVVSPSSEFSSPSTIGSSSCSNTPSTDTESSSSADENPSCSRISSLFLNEFRGMAKLMHPYSNSYTRSSPLPEFNWADQSEVWQAMVLKDSVYQKDSKLLKRHPEIAPEMRSILFDWMSEVCEVYRIHRETFHLAIDYVDRYMSVKSNLPRNCLQLLGATALFIAAKVEEIYPPKIDQFAFVTDGACKESDILAQELVLVATLKWDLTPVTVNCWLNMFLQLVFVENEENFLKYQGFPKQLFLQMSMVLDMCLLDGESLRYSYRVLAASAVAHFISQATAAHVSGLTYKELAQCYSWMKPYVEVANENPVPHLELFNEITEEDSLNIQTHLVGLKFLEIVHKRRKNKENEESPSLVLRDMTPPLSSSKKPHLMKIVE